MKEIHFHKYGRKLESFIGDPFLVTYEFPAVDENIAFSFINSQANIQIGNRNILIRPNMGTLTIKNYSIVEGENTIGEIDNPSLTFVYPCIRLQSGECYSIKKIHTGLLSFIGIPNRHYFELKNHTNRIRYIFSKGKYMNILNPNQRFREIDGKIESIQNDDIWIALLGLFLIELILDKEN